MNMKKVMAVFSAACALVAATHAVPAYAKDCRTGLSFVGDPEVLPCTSDEAAGEGTIDLVTFTQTTNTWEYTWEYFFGDPSDEAVLLDSDGVSRTFSVQTGNPCPIAFDRGAGTGDGQAVTRQCETFASDLEGGAFFYRVRIPGN